MRSSTVFPRPISSASTPPRTSSDAPNASSETWPVCQLTYAAGGGETEEAEDAAFSSAPTRSGSPSRRSGRHSGCVAAAPRPEPANHPYPASSSPTSSSLARSPRFVSAAAPPFSRRIIHSTARRWYPRGSAELGEVAREKGFCAGERASRDSPPRAAAAAAAAAAGAPRRTPRGSRRPAPPFASSEPSSDRSSEPSGTDLRRGGPLFSVAAFGIASSPPRISSVAARGGDRLDPRGDAVDARVRRGEPRERRAEPRVRAAPGPLLGVRRGGERRVRQRDEERRRRRRRRRRASLLRRRSRARRRGRARRTRGRARGRRGRSASHDVDDEEKEEAAAVAGRPRRASESIGSRRRRGRRRR